MHKISADGSCKSVCDLAVLNNFWHLLGWKCGTCDGATPPLPSTQPSTQPTSQPSPQPDVVRDGWTFPSLNWDVMTWRPKSPPEAEVKRPFREILWDALRWRPTENATNRPHLPKFKFNWLRWRPRHRAVPQPPSPPAPSPIPPVYNNSPVRVPSSKKGVGKSSKSSKSKGSKGMRTSHDSDDYTFGERNWKASSSKNSKGKNGGSKNSKSKASKNSRIADVSIEHRSSKASKDSSGSVGSGSRTYTISKPPGTAYKPNKQGDDKAAALQSVDANGTDQDVGLASNQDLSADMKSLDNTNQGGVSMLDDDENKKVKMNQDATGVIMPDNETAGSLKDNSGDDGAPGGSMKDMIVNKKEFDGDISTLSGMKPGGTEATTKTPYSANDEGDTSNESYGQVPAESSSASMESLGGETKTSGAMNVPMDGTAEESASSRVGPYLMTLLYASIFLGALFGAIWLVRRWALKENDELKVE